MNRCIELICQHCGIEAKVPREEVEWCFADGLTEDDYVCNECTHDQIHQDYDVKNRPMIH